MAKGRTEMGIMSLFIVLIIVVALSTVIMRSIMNSMSGFEDAPAAQSMAALTTTSGYDGQVPTSMNGMVSPRCRSPNGSGQPCDDATFCDGASQSCVKKAMFGSSDLNGVDGYYS
jgi:Tfp pilus assembly protein PilV